VKSIGIFPNTFIKGFAVKRIFSFVNSAYKTMEQITYGQLEGVIISQTSQTDIFMKRWWTCKIGTMI